MVKLDNRSIKQRLDVIEHKLERLKWDKAGNIYVQEIDREINRKINLLLEHLGLRIKYQNEYPKEEIVKKEKE